MVYIIYEGAVYAGNAIAFGAITFVINAVTIPMAARISLVVLIPGIPRDTLGGLTLITPVLALAAQAYVASRSQLSRALVG